MVLLVILALGPGNWTPRTALGWQIDHFLGYFAITSMFCLAWLLRALRLLASICLKAHGRARSDRVVAR
jgi:hypothetical protein